MAYYNLGAIDPNITTPIKRWHTNKDGTKCWMLGPGWCVDWTCDTHQRPITNEEVDILLKQGRGDEIKVCVPESAEIREAKQQATGFPSRSRVSPNREEYVIPEKSTAIGATVKWPTRWDPAYDSLGKGGRQINGKVDADGYILWENPPVEVMRVIGALLEHYWPANNDGELIHSGDQGAYPLPTRDWGSSRASGWIPGIPGNTENVPLDPPIEYVEAHKRIIAKMPNGATRDGMIAGTKPFLKFTNLALSHLNKDLPKSAGHGAREINDGMGLYYGTTTGGKIYIRRFSYIDTDVNNVVGWLKDPITTIGGGVQAAVENVVKPVITALSPPVPQNQYPQVTTSGFPLNLTTVLLLGGAGLAAYLLANRSKGAKGGKTMRSPKRKHSDRGI